MPEYNFNYHRGKEIYEAAIEKVYVRKVKRPIESYYNKHSAMMFIDDIREWVATHKVVNSKELWRYLKTLGFAGALNTIRRCIRFKAYEIDYESEWGEAMNDVREKEA
jgi:hypothetical protein